ncbi:hypothetical protein BDW59DRAFT_161060 [Aspergillus cavernicola]|uniref:Phytanoyl-CoA dioxygenase family protein n=1 Tax=Aspergillus cavernicola TaxID=176166 RepID=A0ABR4IEN3_9EURO
MGSAIEPRIQRFHHSAGVDEIFKALEEDGFVIIKGFIPEDQVKRFNEEIQPALDKVPPAVTENGIPWVKRCSKVVTSSPTFRDEIMDNNLLYQLCDRVFSKESGAPGYHFNDSVALDLLPGAPAQRLHRDQELFSFWNSMGPNAPDCFLNIMCAITPFTAGNGATVIVPGSHRWPKFTFIGENDHKEDPRIQTMLALMDPGDCYVMRGNLVHGAGANCTTSDQRRALSFSIIRSDLRSMQAFPLWVPVETARQMTRRAQAMFGFRSSTQQCLMDTVQFWSNEGKDIGEHLGLPSDN